ncbi:hypothetical protein Cgig2_018078 [Carnegiea gigantea]|uniref:Uncharacterized protein n=1 Tax=Carnegiea gigantea TaxID=171969 RepID=A0A9Q1JZ52_9CARY|nr:hypothetical protein Cgig2_018078 [Carnegiea gigantea]
MASHDLKISVAGWFCKHPDRRQVPGSHLPAYVGIRFPPHLQCRLEKTLPPSSMSAKAESSTVTHAANAPLRWSRRRVDVHTAGYLVCSDFPATDGWFRGVGRPRRKKAVYQLLRRRRMYAPPLRGVSDGMGDEDAWVWGFFGGVGVGVKDELDVNGGSYASDVNVRGHGKKEFHNFRGLAEILFPTSLGGTEDAWVWGFFGGVGVGVNDELDVNGGSYASDVNVRGHRKKEFHNVRGLVEILFRTSLGIMDHLDAQNIQPPQSAIALPDELDVNGDSYASDVNVRGHGKKEFHNFRGLAEILFPTSPGVMDYVSILNLKVILAGVHQMMGIVNSCNSKALSIFILK